MSEKLYKGRNYARVLIQYEMMNAAGMKTILRIIYFCSQEPSWYTVHKNATTTQGWKTSFNQHVLTLCHDPVLISQHKTN